MCGVTEIVWISMCGVTEIAWISHKLSGYHTDCLDIDVWGHRDCLDIDVWGHKDCLDITETVWISMCGVT